MSIREIEAAEAIDREVAEAIAEENERIERRAAAYRRRVAAQAPASRLSAQHPSTQTFSAAPAVAAAVA